MMSRSDEEAFGRWLGRQLKVRRMSQRQLAARSGIHHSTISRLIRSDRQPSLGTAARIARVLRDADDTAVIPRHPDLASETALDPIARVERALRADERLSEAQVRRLMYQYLSERQSAGQAQNGGDRSGRLQPGRTKLPGTSQSGVRPVGR